MNRRSFVIAQCTNDFPQNDMLSERPFSSVVSRLYGRMDDKREPVLKAIANLANKFSDLDVFVFFCDQLTELYSRLVP